MSTKKVHQLSLRLDEQENARLQRVAERLGLGMQDALRFLTKRADDDANGGKP